MPAVELKYAPQPKQAALHSCTARQILYGGAAGGGKSHAIRWDGILACLEEPGISAFLFRRTYKQLVQNHVMRIVSEIPTSVAKLRDDALHFANGSTLFMSHCNDMMSYLDHQGSEMHWLGIDEASLFYPIQLIELRARVRLGGFSEKIKKTGYYPRMVLSSNPGGPGHSWLKQTFLDQAPPMTVFKDARMANDLGMEPWATCYIPARMADNRYLDVDYGVQFAGMNPARAKALRDGDWDTVEGSVLFNLSRQRHGIKPFSPPEHWVRFMSLDWGTAKPYSVAWYCVAGEDTVVRNNAHLSPTDTNPDRAVFVPAGAVIRYDEMYGCAENQPDVGVYADSTEVARDIVQRETERKDRAPDYRVCDTAIFSRVDGPSVAERMEGASRGKIMFGRVVKSNAVKYHEWIARLAGNPYLMSNGRVEKHPTLFISTSCVHAWRTLPTLIADPLKPDAGPGDRQEDHIYDECGYALMSRPYAQTKREFHQETETWTETVGIRDPYAVRR